MTLTGIVLLIVSLVCGVLACVYDHFFDWVIHCYNLLSSAHVLAGTASTNLNWGTVEAGFISSAWDGVTVETIDGVPHITALDLSGLGLNGRLDDDVNLKHLLKLRSLDLSNNHITGYVPDFLGTLAERFQLNVLMLSGNLLEQCMDPALKARLLDNLTTTDIDRFVCWPALPDAPGAGLACLNATAEHLVHKVPDTTQFNSPDGTLHVAHSAVYRGPWGKAFARDAQGDFLWCAYGVVMNASSQEVTTRITGQLYYGDLEDSGDLQKSTPAAGHLCTNSEECAWRSGVMQAGLWTGTTTGLRVYVFGKHEITVDRHPTIARTSGGFNPEDRLGPYAKPPPHAPYGLSVATAGPFSVTLDWDSQSGVGSYEIIKRMVGHEEWTVAATASGSTTTYIVPLASCATTYEFQVRAQGNGTDYATVWSPHSLTVTASTAQCSI